MIFADVHLYSIENIKTKEDFFLKLKSNVNYIYHLSPAVKPVFIQHLGFEGQVARDNTQFYFRKINNRRWNLFLSFFFRLKKLKPNVVLLHGFHKPHLVIIAKIILGKKVRLLVQNHAEQPAFGLKGLLQKVTSKFVTAFLFVSVDQTQVWRNRGIMSPDKKIVEVMEGSTEFGLQQKGTLENSTKNNEIIRFLWVGRLDDNKDPLTILKAFSKFIKVNPNIGLKMIFGTKDLLGEVQQFISENIPNNFVDLVGEVEHALLENYYNKADYFILGSHTESGGYAMCEAMACGCVPIVTNIPSFYKMTNSGQCGYLFKPGDAEDLFSVLKDIHFSEREKMRTLVLQQFKEALSFEAIAKKISKLIFESV